MASRRSLRAQAEIDATDTCLSLTASASALRIASLLGRAAYFACVLVAACGRIDFGPRVDGDARAIDGVPDAVPVVPSGAIAWWKLDDDSGITALDSIGGANGTLMPGMTGLPTWTTGYHGSALAFAGNADYVEIGSPPQLTNLPALTVAAWIDPTDLSVGDRCVVDKGNTNMGWYMPVGFANAADLGFVGQFATNNASRISAGNAVLLGTWTHVVATWDGGALASGIHIYVNGVETAYASSVDATSARLDDSGTGLSINCTALTGLVGDIDEVLMWNRTLSASDVQSLYEATR